MLSPWSERVPKEQVKMAEPTMQVQPSLSSQKEEKPLRSASSAVYTERTTPQRDTPWPSNCLRYLQSRIVSFSFSASWHFFLALGSIIKEQKKLNVQPKLLQWNTEIFLCPLKHWQSLGIVVNRSNFLQDSSFFFFPLLQKLNLSHTSLSAWSRTQAMFTLRSF